MEMVKKYEIEIQHCFDNNKSISNCRGSIYASLHPYPVGNAFIRS